MNRFGGSHDERLGSRKQRLLGALEGTVVDLGAGTGVNLRYLPEPARYVAVEPNVHMHPYLRAEAERLGREIVLRGGTGESLPFGRGSVDAVVSTLVMCSVTDAAAVLGEIHRVLRPGGRFVFIEHVGASRGSSLLRLQRVVRPLWQRLGDGCQPDRDLEPVLRGAGFRELEVERFELPVPVVRPHIAGQARR
jgi:SAM-dependent methyltransferase